MWCWIWMDLETNQVLHKSLLSSFLLRKWYFCPPPPLPWSLCFWYSFLSQGWCCFWDWSYTFGDHVFWQGNRSWDICRFEISQRGEGRCGRQCGIPWRLWTAGLLNSRRPSRAETSRWWPFQSVHHGRLRTFQHRWPYQDLSNFVSLSLKTYIYLKKWIF